jgi:NADH-quinone oxidoreductase subunit J
MDTQAFFFWAIAILTSLCALAVVVSQNIVRMATWLLFTLAGASGIFFLLGFDFVGATQLLIYVGGTLVLVVFGVMLTAQGPFITMKTGAAEWIISTAVGLLLFTVLAVVIIQSNLKETFPKQNVPESPAASRYSEQLGAAFLNVKEATPDGNLTGMPGGNTIPRMKMAYLLPFEIVSVHLLVVLIGAAYLARAKRRVRKEGEVA